MNDVGMMFGWCLKWCLKHNWMIFVCHFAVVATCLLSEWYLNDVWMMSERCLNDVRCQFDVVFILGCHVGTFLYVLLSKSYLNVVWMMSGWCLDDVWNDVWTMFGWCPAVILLLLSILCCLSDISMMSEQCLNVVLLSFWYCFHFLVV